MVEGGQRLDKWLFFARIVKSRTLAQKLVLAGNVRHNREKTDNPARILRVGDGLTVKLQDRVRVLRVLDPGTRRGPASEAATLYEDLSEPVESVREKRGSGPSDAPGFKPPERPPSKKERRALDRMRRDNEP